MLRVHQLGGLAPLVRRALLSTWLLPDQVAQLLDIWKGGAEVLETPCSELVAASRATISSLSKSFPGAFMPFAGELAKQLPESSAEDAKVILQTLAAIAKRVLQKPASDSQLSVQGLSQMLLDALSVAGDSRGSRASMSRKVAKILLLLPAGERSMVCMELLKWAQEIKDETTDVAPKLQALALQLSAALLEWSKRHPEDFPQVDAEIFKMWHKEARQVLATPNSGRDEEKSDVQCAAADLMAVTGSTEDVTDVLLAPSIVSESLALTNSAGGERMLGAWKRSKFHRFKLFEGGICYV